MLLMKLYLAAYAFILWEERVVIWLAMFCAGNLVFRSITAFNV